jgi:hypothetical protein
MLAMFTPPAGWGFWIFSHISSSFDTLNFILGGSPDSGCFGGADHLQSDGFLPDRIIQVS